MTRDELHRFMTGTLAPTLERAWYERDTQAKRAEQYREEAEQSREEAKREREARKRRRGNPLTRTRRSNA